MPRFTVWSPFDGEPLPVRNKQERDALTGRGYLADPPDQPKEEGNDEPRGDAGPDGGGLPSDDKRRRVRGRTEPVAGRVGDDAGSDREVPPPVE